MATNVIQVMNNHYPIEGYKEKIFCYVLQFGFFQSHKYLFCSFSVFSFLVTSCATHHKESPSSYQPEN